MRLLAYLQSLAWCIIPALGNVEKTIFLAPEAIHIPQQHPHLGDLKLEVLTPWNSTLRRQLPAAFPKSGLDKGKEAWFLLDGLTPQQRYEVRICWAATQPTAFILDTHSLAAAFDTPELITSLAVYSESRQTSDSPVRDPRLHSSRAGSSAILFLRVVAAADYYTSNETLMQNVPLVNVDIILDPYLLNIFPRSLVPTAGYLIILAVLGWYLSGYILQHLYQVAHLPEKEDASFNASAEISRNKKVL